MPERIAARHPGGSDQQPPPFAQHALIVVIGEPFAARVAVDEAHGRSDITSGLGAALRYVEEHRERGAKLTALYPERTVTLLGDKSMDAEGSHGWQIAVPNRDSPWHAMSAFHYLELADADDLRSMNATLEMRLRADRSIRALYHPAVPYAWDPPAQAPIGNLKPDWALEECGFPAVWEVLDEQGGDPGPIGVIDDGPDNGHEEIAGRVKEYRIQHGQPSELIHASSVVGVLTAQRKPDKGMKGCCSSQIHLHNVGTASGIAPKDFILALKSAACKGLRVVNISLSMTRDLCVELQINECIRQGMIIVAATGNDGSNVATFPAAYEGVWAVGASDRGNERLIASNYGPHVFISAPGEYIYTISDSDELDYKHGTSYAAPMVSAAAWLALRARPYWTAQQVKHLLSRSVHRTGQYDTQIGFGRLDMRRMLNALTC